MSVSTFTELVSALTALGGLFYARRASVLSKPTGNGFANLVITTLKDIQVRLTKVEERLDNERPVR